MKEKRIEDFGKKIGGARKELWASRGLMIDDLDEMTDMEKNQYVKRDYIWPKPDMKMQLEEGLPRTVVYFRNEVRKTVHQTPERISVEDYIEGVRIIKELTEKIRKESDISLFSDQIRDGVVFQKDYAYQYSYAGYYQWIVKGNALLRLSSSYGLNSMKRKMDKANFGLNDEQIMKKNFPVVFIDGAEYTVDTDRGKVFIQRKTAAGFYYYFPRTASCVPENNKYAILAVNRNDIVFCSDSEEECKEEQKRLYEANKELSVKPRKTSKKKWVPKQFTHLRRTGKIYRRGNRHVSGEDLIKTFGLRGGEFGNYVSNDERQASLDYSYDAFADLAYALGMDKQSVALHGLSNGTLAIAFGARGRGDALAHYEPLREVINITKLRGAGSLAHEWGHALDHLIGEKSGCPELATESMRGYYVPFELKHVMECIKYKDGGGFTDYYYESSKFNNMYSKAGHGYWTSSCEMFARAFECYIKDKLSEKECCDDYLCGNAEACVSMDNDGNVIHAYPRGEERKRINHAMDLLVAYLFKEEIFAQASEEEPEEIMDEKKHIPEFNLLEEADGQMKFA